MIGTKVEGALGRRGVPALRHVRRAVRLHRGHGGDAGRDRRSGRRSTRRWKGQRDKARAGSAFGGGKKGEEFARRRRDRTRSTTGDQFEGYTSTRVSGVPIVALFDEQRQPVDALGEGPGRLRRAGADAVLPRGRRPGVGCRAASSTRRRRVGDGRRARADPPRAAARAPRPRHVRRASRARHRDRRSGRRRPRRDAAQSHGDASAARGAARGARHARQAGRLARGARSPAVRLRALPAGDARRARSHRAHRQRADLPQHAGDDRGAVDAGGDRGRRDGALRRKVRRQGARRQRARVQHGAVRRHARQARPATSASSRSSPKAASRRACAGSRR